MRNLQSLVVIACLLALSVHAGTTIDESRFSQGIDIIGYVATKKLQKVWEEERSGEVELSRDEPFVLLRAEGVVHGHPAFVYVIKSGDFFDFVFFKEEQSTQGVLLYFVNRWSYIADGIQKGYIHFSEDYTGKFIEDEEFVNFFSNYSEVFQEGSVHGNQVFNSVRAGMLKSYACTVAEILEAMSRS